MEKFYDIDKIVVAKFKVAYSNEYVDGYYGEKSFSQLFDVSEKGVFRDIFSDKYIMGVAKGYSEIDRTTLTIYGLNKISYAYFTKEELMRGTVSESKLLEIYFKLNKIDDILENKKIDVGSSDSIVNIKTYKRKK